MTAPALLERLKAHGASVEADGDRLKLAAPPGVLRPPLLEELASHKAEILQLLELERRSKNTPPLTTADRQTERIRRLSANVTPAELLAAHRQIKPTLKKQLSADDLNELACTLAIAAKKNKPTGHRAACTFNAGEAYRTNQKENNYAKRN